MYAALRDADAKGIKKVVAITPEGDGIAIAIRDRLERASKGR
jgi:L-threonylcarbamoyladenylate synthase